MARRCSICSHADRAAIEAAAAQDGRRAAARTYGIAESSLRRHLESHGVQTQSAPAIRSVVLAKINEGFDLLEALERPLAQIVRDAQATGDLATALKAITGFTRVRGEIRANFTLLSHLEPDENDAVVDLLTSPAWAAVKAVIDDVLVAHPAAKDALALRLKEMTDGQR
jgi:hypothetical protein